MSKYRLLINVSLVVALLLMVAGAGLADNDWNKYYQFRHSSALPGNLFGVTPEGEVGFAGALQQNIPVAYTPVQGNWVLGANSGSNSSRIEFGLSGAGVNGTAFLGAGCGRPGHGIYISDMDTGSDHAQAFNIQIQVAGGGENGPAVAIGSQDVFNMREDYVGNPHGARSIYIVATAALPQATWRPIYWTLGWGDGRFNSHPFGGLSVPISDHLRAVGEYDGFNVNGGVAYGVHGADSEKPADIIGYFGYSDLARPVLGLTFTWR